MVITDTVGEAEFEPVLWVKKKLFHSGAQGSQRGRDEKHTRAMEANSLDTKSDSSYRENHLASQRNFGPGPAAAILVNINIELVRSSYRGTEEENTDTIL